MNTEIDWLLSNSLPLREADEVTSINILARGRDEVKNVLRGKEWKNNLIPIFTGKSCYLENSSLLNKDDIIRSREELLSWIIDNLFYIDKRGISVRRSGKKSVHMLNFLHESSHPEQIFANEYTSRWIHLPEISFNGSWFREENKSRETKQVIDTIFNIGLDDAIVLRPGLDPTRLKSFTDLINSVNFTGNRKNKIATSVYGENYSGYLYNLAGKETLLGIIRRCYDDSHYGLYDQPDNTPYQYKINDDVITRDGILKFAFNKVNDFAIDLSYANSKTYSLVSLQNFPNIVYGSLLFYRWYVNASFEGFPKMIHNDLIFSDCFFKDLIKIPEGIKIKGNVVIDAMNPHLMLLSLIKSDIIIEGNIYSSVYTGSFTHLKELSKINKWENLY